MLTPVWLKHCYNEPAFTGQRASPGSLDGNSATLSMQNATTLLYAAEPNYKSVKIEPAFGKWKYIKASYPHYLVDIKVDLKKKTGKHD